MGLANVIIVVLYASDCQVDIKVSADKFAVVAAIAVLDRSAYGCLVVGVESSPAKNTAYSKIFLALVGVKG